MLYILGDSVCFPCSRQSEITNKKKKMLKDEVTLISHEYSILCITRICDVLNKVHLDTVLCILDCCHEDSKSKSLGSQTFCIRGCVVYIISKVSKGLYRRAPENKICSL